MAKYIVAGASHFDGTINGEKIRSCKVFLLARMDSTTGNRIGYQTIEMRAPYELWDRLRSIVPMQEYECNIEMVAAGKGEMRPFFAGIEIPTVASALNSGSSQSAFIPESTPAKGETKSPFPGK